MTGFFNAIDPCFLSNNAAVLQYTQFAYMEESTTRRLRKVATSKPGSFEKEWKKMNVAPPVIRGSFVMGEAAVILIKVRPES